MSDGEELRILIVEDLPEDAEIAVRELRKSGLGFEHRRVDTKEAFMAALADFEPTMIVSDYSMPRFDGMRALKLALDWNPAVPFIVLTGSKNEETAVLCLKSGAIDYIIKSHIGRLPYAVAEALEQVRLNRGKEAASRALRESEQSYRTLADSGQALIWTSGADKLCSYFNKPWLDFTGRPIERELGEGWIEGVHPDDLARCIETYSTAFDRREKLDMVYRLRRRDGEYRWIQDAGCPRYDSGGEFLGYIGHCLDVTERKVAEERIQLALEEKESLLRELFHRTRNNMQVIMAILALEENAAGEACVAEVVRKTSERIMTMSLVHKNLYESKDLSRVDVKDYAEELLSYLEMDDSFPRERVGVRSTVESMDMLIDAAIPFGLVLHELLSNAFRHAYPGDARGEVRLGLAKTPEGRVDLSVSDDGVGLPEGYDPRDGLSLGFLLVHGLVEQQLKGSLSIEATGGAAGGLTCRVSFMDARGIKKVAHG